MAIHANQTGGILKWKENGLRDIVHMASRTHPSTSVTIRLNSQSVWKQHLGQNVQFTMTQNNVWEFGQ